VVLSVTDNDGATGQASLQYDVIYDTNNNGTFVTGGGWFNSPAGAYTAIPTVTGKANFGFVVKAGKGSAKPTGSTKFHLNNANFKFASTSYSSLSINGANATFQGSGTINGSGNYSFMVKVVDGQVSGGGGVDKFSIKIWNPQTNQVLYDNTAAPIALGGGSIIVHK
jgi:hypothetical protein